MAPVKNLSASVRDRLLARARAENRPFNELLQYYAMERFLYRLAKSRYSRQFILKGALMLRVWQSPESRPTMDVDLLGYGNNEPGRIMARVREILSTSVEADGLNFEPSSVQAESITEDADYEGLRIKFRGTLGTARINMQLDIGFGDVIFPEPELSEYPTILDFPAPQLQCYSRESAIAEKFEAMVKLGRLNSRMKDFYDIWLLCRHFDFDSDRLTDAIRRTFARRRTAIPSLVVALSSEFGDLKQAQWSAFRRRLGQDYLPVAFNDIIAVIRNFLEPVVIALESQTAFSSKWTAGGPWRSTISIRPTPW